MMQKCVKAWVYGKVQGVGYRMFCKRKAKEIGLVGYALNLQDGRVEVLMCGEEEGIQLMIESLHQGPAFAQVLGVDVEPCEKQVATGFMTG
ncbi:acylphosphatase [Reinekea sp. G2M2-21]|uniref:acylphosphatase n=1 Tax=Reinekea sp. G2M2-21 TaxID=2788942 RepID=UPI0018A9C6C1|nr:acylphosphatase [Reinekea sp. G2M2-21]